MKRRTEITIETERIFIVNKPGAPQHLERRPRRLIWCLECAEQVTPLTTDEAAIQFQISSPALFQLFEKRVLHFIETADRRLLICPNYILSHPQEKL